MVLVVVFVLGRALLHFLAGFTFWARGLLAFFQKFWLGLTQPSLSASKPPEKMPATPRPFASFTDPFASGKAEYLSTAELVRYSFAALEAWARENDKPRDVSETPIEFCRRMSVSLPSLDADARQLGVLYARLAYSVDALPAEATKTLRNFWRNLARAVEKVPAA